MLRIAYSFNLLVFTCIFLLFSLILILLGYVSMIVVKLRLLCLPVEAQKDHKQFWTAYH